MRSKQFGGKLTEHWRSRYEASPNWKNGAFRNLEETQTAINWRQLPGIICKQIKGHKQGYPAKPLPVEKFDKDAFLKDGESTKMIWFGHSVVLMRIAGISILIDPMLGSDSSPIAPKKTQRFSENTLDIIDALPEIDLVLLTHDHYDHLDHASIQKLKTKVKQFYTALGLKRHLISWGVNEDTVHEFDWWEHRSLNGLHITFTPTRHFSGRGLTSIAKCLWGGWTIDTGKQNIWFSGDGGYGDHFKEIGQRLGPFDFAFMECGQYSDDWPQIHMFPHETVQAAMDAGARSAMPVHWAGFNLSYQHAWHEPAEEFAKHAGNSNLPILTPALGQIFEIGSETKFWWRDYI